MRYLLKDITTIERAVKGINYPKDLILIQVSATKGQVILHKGGKVETKYAVIKANREDLIKTKFLFIYLEHTMPYYLKKIKTGINIQIEELEKYPIGFPINYNIML